MKKLFKIILIIAFLAFILLSLLTGYFYFNSKGIINKFKPLIEEQLSEKLEGNINLGEIDIKAFPPISLNIKDISIKNNDDITKLNEVLVKLNAFKLIKKEIEIKKLVIKNSAIKIIQKANKTYIPGLELSSVKKEDGPKEKLDNQKEKLNISAELIELKDISFNLNNLDKKTTKNLFLKNLTTKIKLENNLLTINKLTSSGIVEKLPFDLILNLFKFDLDAKNLEFKNSNLTILNIKNTFYGDFNLNEEKANFNIQNSNVNLSDFKSLLKGLDINGNLENNFDISIKNKNINIKGLSKINDFVFQNPKFKVNNLNSVVNIDGSLDNLNFKINNEDFLFNNEKLKTDEIQVAFKNKKISTNKFNTKLLNGDLNTKINYDLGKGTKNIDLSIKQIALENLLLLKDPNYNKQLTGKINSLNSIVYIDKNNSIRLSGDVDLVDGKITKVNILNQVLKEIKKIPKIDEKIKNFSADQIEVLNRDFTKIKSLNTKFDINSNNLKVKDLEFISDFFSIQASGTKKSNTLDLDSNFVFDKIISNSIINEVKEFKYILNSKNEIVFPLKIYGDLPIPIFQPDIKNIFNKAVKSKIKDKALEFLDKELKDSTKPIIKDTIIDSLKAFGF